MKMKPQIRITKEFRFEMAHALPNHPGLCRNIHGHSYTLSVTVIGEPISDLSKPDAGMVMDFGDLKSIVRQKIVQKFDHALVLHHQTNDSLIRELKANFEKIIMVDYQPSRELLLLDFVNLIKPELPDGVGLFSLKLRETATSVAEWFAADN